MPYTLAVTGISANANNATKALTLADANATSGGQKQAMAQGTQFLCQRLDGSQGFYRLDAERSTPANPILIAVGP